MEFLKDMFTEPLSYEAFEKAVNSKGLKLADLSNGEYISKGKFDRVSGELREAKETIATMTTELDGLKEAGASAEEWKQKFEDLQTTVSEKERAAKEQAAAAEKEANYRARFDTAAVSRKTGEPLNWAHEAIKEYHFKKFVEAIENPANQGKSDNDIFDSSTKDDARAFEGIQKITLAGGKPLDTGADDIAAARAIMGLND